MSDRQYIKLSLQLAKTLIDQGNQLFNAGAGALDDTDSLTAVDGVEVPDAPLGIIDEMPLDSDMFHWANAMLSFARYVARLLQHEIDEQDLLTITEDGEL